MELSHYVREIFPFKSLIKKVIDNLGIDHDNMKFLSSFTLYKNNGEFIAVGERPRMTPTSNHIAVKNDFFWKHIGKEFVIPKIETGPNVTELV